MTASDQHAGWQIVGASVVGTSHLQRSIPCQDASRWYQAEGVLAVAVADGAGSASHSHRGAALAVESLTRAVAGLHSRHPLTGGVARSLVRYLFGSALKRIGREARHHGLEASGLASTLALALVTRSEILLAQVGDGTMVAERDGQTILAVAQTQKGEYANETTFLTSTDALDHIGMDVLSLEEVSGLALATDGLRMVALDRPATGNPHRPFFEDAFAFARSPRATNAAIERFLSTVNDRTGDDKTLVIAVRSG